jgi:hypothetical protein
MFKRKYFELMSELFLILKSFMDHKSGVHLKRKLVNLQSLTFFRFYTRYEVCGRDVTLENAHLLLIHNKNHAII